MELYAVSVCNFSEQMYYKDVVIKEFNQHSQVLIKVMGIQHKCWIFLHKLRFSRLGKSFADPFSHELVDTSSLGPIQ